MEGEGEQGLVVEAEAAAPGMVGGVVSYDLREGRRGGGAGVVGSPVEKAGEGLLCAERAVRGAVDDSPLGGEGEGREPGEATAATSGREVE